MNDTDIGLISFVRTLGDFDFVRKGGTGLKHRSCNFSLIKFVFDLLHYVSWGSIYDLFRLLLIATVE